MKLVSYDWKSDIRHCFHVEFHLTEFQSFTFMHINLEWLNESYRALRHAGEDGYKRTCLATSLIVKFSEQVGQYFSARYRPTVQNTERD
jgi:hypothetical protein